MSLSAPDPASEQGSSDAAFAYLLTKGIPEAAGILTQAQHLAGERGLRQVRLAILDVLNGLLTDVNDVAVRMAGYADGAIIRKIATSHTSNRPITGVMDTHIVSKPGPLGSVRVALISELDKIINPTGYGPFWRAQEYGTGVEEDGPGTGAVPSQLDRVFLGTFETSGTAPNADLRGEGVGTDLAFLPGGRSPGFGTITTELPGRHFLRDGSEEAGAHYVQAMDTVMVKWNKRIAEIVSELKAASGGGRRIIRAKLSA